MQHELAHVRMRHSLLLLNASLLLCLQWFNPAAWLLLRDLRQNCEFEADDAVLSSGADRRGYQLSLVGRAARGMAVSLASPFRNSWWGGLQGGWPYRWPARSAIPLSTAVSP